MFEADSKIIIEALQPLIGILTTIGEQTTTIAKRLSENQRKLEAIEQELILIRRASDRAR